MESNRYQKRGVSSKKEDVHDAIKNIDKGLFPKSFCKIIPDYITKSEDHVVVMHADGAGTKSSLAYIYWKETGDNSVWKGVVQDSIIMNVDDLLCVGVTNEIMLSSIIGRNKNRIPAEVVSSIINGTQEIIDELDSLDIKIYNTGGETADVGDLVQTVIIDSCVFSRMPRKDVIDNANISDGDLIIGLASFGQSTYEKQYNSGIGSNGLTSARHDVFSKYLMNKYPESFDSSIPDELVYSGSKFLTDSLDSVPIDIGKMILSPTRTYAPVIKKIFDQINRVDIHGMVHCSGGGQTKALNFVEDLHIIKDNLFKTPPVFELIQRESGTSSKEMYQVFNMGHRMELYVNPEIADKIIEISKSFQIDAKVIGKVETCKTRKLSIFSEMGNFEY
ncbi:MAG: phosphoribosylformylglycinamidine cyclo-ligase [Flavobacteriaceae bacterium TMED184]|nr:MAG: phosphoribosylformylglycinamidine cyclo-ligase [Flavobacteriaceae bacterium TMED184]|tara:strand:+ start:1365 stop:2534 length:1170 start_codon:yes stop_codon:yes gene_type:complete